MLIRTAAAMLVMSSVGTAPETPGHDELGPRLVLAAGSAPPPGSANTYSPEQKMQRRYPQPVKVGDLIGLPVLDDDDRTLGRIKSIVRTAGGKIQLIMSYGGFLGWRARLVAVPIEVVAIAGRQLAALDMTRAEFDAAPAWSDPQSQVIPTTDVILIGTSSPCGFVDHDRHGEVQAPEDDLVIVDRPAAQDENDHRHGVDPMHDAQGERMESLSPSTSKPRA